MFKSELRSISFLYSPLWLKTSQILRHMTNIFVFGDVASGQRQRCICKSEAQGVLLLMDNSVHSSIRVLYGVWMTCASQGGK